MLTSSLNCCLFVAGGIGTRDWTRPNHTLPFRHLPAPVASAWAAGVKGELRSPSNPDQEHLTREALIAPGSPELGRGRTLQLNEQPPPSSPIPELDGAATPVSVAKALMAALNNASTNASSDLGSCLEEAASSSCPVDGCMGARVAQRPVRAVPHLDTESPGQQLDTDNTLC